MLVQAAATAGCTPAMRVPALRSDVAVRRLVAAPRRTVCVPLSGAGAIPIAKAQQLVEVLREAAV